MECDRAREAISARIDGEDQSAPAGTLEAHLADCAACRDWQQRAHAVTRRARLGGPFLDRDLTPGVLAAVSPGTGRRGLVPRAGLAAVALAQFAITGPLLMLGRDHGAGAHAAHELGSFDLGLAIAFAVAVFRPALSAGLAWPSGIAAVALAATAIADLAGGEAVGADEAQHLIALAGAVLLCWQARTARAGTAGPAAADGPGLAGADPLVPGGAVYLLDGPPSSPDGGTGAARIAAADPTAGPLRRAAVGGGRRRNARGRAADREDDLRSVRGPRGGPYEIM